MCEFPRGFHHKKLIGNILIISVLMKLTKIIEIAEHDLNEGVTLFNPIQDEG